MHENKKRSVEATHKISTVYFPGKNEVTATWEDVET